MSSENQKASYWSGYELMWGLADTAPARRTTLDRDQIVAAAIGLADTDGLPGVTMRKVAERLGTGPMSLYRYVPDKDALVSLMLDRILADSESELDGTQMPEGWRQGLRLVTAAMWKLCRAHPWYPEASMVRPPLTPHGVAGLEVALSIFDDYDLSIDTKMQFVGAVAFSVQAAGLNLAIEERGMAQLGVSEAEAMEAGVPFIRRMMESGDFPRVSRFISDAEHLTHEDQMWAGVDLILDGIAHRLGEG